MKTYKPGDKIWIHYVMDEVYEATILCAKPRTGEGYYEYGMTRKGKSFKKKDHCDYFMEVGDVATLVQHGWRLVGTASNARDAT